MISVLLDEPALKDAPGHGEALNRLRDLALPRGQFAFCFEESREEN